MATTSRGNGIPSSFPSDYSNTLAQFQANQFPDNSQMMPGSAAYEALTRASFAMNAGMRMPNNANQQMQLAQAMMRNQNMAHMQGRPMPQLTPEQMTAMSQAMYQAATAGRNPTSDAMIIGAHFPPTMYFPPQSYPGMPFALANGMPITSFGPGAFYGTKPNFGNDMDLGAATGGGQQNSTSNGEKRMGYSCKYCSKTFTLKGNLKRHFYTHAGIKPFTCTICTKGFSRKADLEIHNRVHTGEKPYFCPFNGCDKRFARISDLRSHERTHR